LPAADGFTRGHSLQHDGGLAYSEDAAGEHVLEAGERHYVGGDMLSALKMFIFSHIM
jgi:hypothetical protein